MDRHIEPIDPIEDYDAKGEEKMAEIMLEKINSAVKDDLGELIAREEAKYKAKITEVAERIDRDGVRVLLLAGPSGSGKTTTANLICDAIKSRGEECMVVSLDDFYRNSDDPDYPRLSDGNLDFECPEALCLDEIRATIENIAHGRPFEIPKYNFKVGARTYVKKYDVHAHACVIIEGLHALNTAICDGIDTNNGVLKLFVSVSTNVNCEGERLMSGRKARFVRRLVRDSIYRNATAERTLRLWQNVLSAEDIYLYPYKKTADMAFDTFHLYELSVMKPYVKKLISDELAEKSGYAHAILAAMRRIETAPDDQIPADSLIREFLPGGKYEHLY